MTPAQLANDKLVRAADRVVTASRLEALGVAAYHRRERRIDQALCFKRERYRRLRAALGMEPQS